MGDVLYVDFFGEVDARFWGEFRGVAVPEGQDDRIRVKAGGWRLGRIVVRGGERLRGGKGWGEVRGRGNVG